MHKIQSRIRISKKEILFFLPLLLAFLLFIKITVLNPTTPDSWTHMGIGRFIVENKKIPSHEEISFKRDLSPSLEWISHSWLADLQFYIAGRVNVLFAGVLMLLPNLIICLYLLYKILIKIRIDKKTIFFLVPIPIILANIFWKVHPLPFTIPLFMVIYLSYLKWRGGEWKYIFLIPLIFIIFANTYGGLIFIPFLLLVFILLTEIGGRIANRFISANLETNGRLRFLFISLIASFFASILNPHTFRIWAYPFTFIGILEKKNWLSSLGGSLMLVNQNFIRTPHSSFLVGIFLIYLLLVIFGLVFILIKKREIIKRNYHLIPLALFALLPILWIRLIPLSVFMTLPFFALILAYFSSSRIKLMKNYLGFVLVLILSISSLYLLFNSPKSIYSPPEKQIELVRKFKLPLNILTTPDITGYAFYSLFPAKAGIDAQDDVFDENELITTFTSPSYVSPEAVEKVTEENNIETVLVNKNLGDLAFIFSQIPNWALIYFDDNGFLFSNREFLEEDFIEENEIKHLDLERTLGFNPQEATKAAQELEKFTSKYPQSYLAVGQLASIYRIQGQFNKSEQTLQKIPKNRWSYITMTEMARLRAAQGYCESSEQWFLKALDDRSERNFSRAVLDLAVLYAGCLNDMEKAKHFLERYNSFQLSPDEREKAREIGEDFGIELED